MSSIPFPAGKIVGNHFMRHKVMKKFLYFALNSIWFLPGFYLEKLFLRRCGVHSLRAFVNTNQTDCNNLLCKSNSWNFRSVKSLYVYEINAQFNSNDQKFNSTIYVVTSHNNGWWLKKYFAFKCAIQWTILCH